jgi:hypothetical protein
VGEILCRVIARTGERKDLSALFQSHLGNDMGGGAKTIEAEIFRRAGHDERAPADETCTE